MDKGNVYIGVEALSNHLNMSESTVKKHYLMVEEHGYKFMRTDQGRVMFSPEDYKLFKKILEFRKQPKTTINDAIIKALNIDKENLPSVLDQDILLEILKEVKEAKEIIQEQEKIITKQNEQIINLSSNNNENIKLLEDSNNSLKKELSDWNKDISLLKEEIQYLKENQNRPRWWEFWK